MHNRLPTGPGSRGGTYHLPGVAAAYSRAWRAAHPEYRERERLRSARKRARDHGSDPADIAVAPAFPRPLPVAAVACICPCGCRNEVPVVACGFCLMGMCE